MNAYTVVQQNLFDLDPLEAERKGKGKTKQNQNSSKDYFFDIMDVFSSPILTFSTNWSDSIPQRLLDVVTIARLKALMQGLHTATYVDCALYLYTRSLEAPMNSEWTDIYTHVTCSALQEWCKVDHWEEVGAPRQLSDWLQKKLDDLLRHIYEKRRSILKKRLLELEKAGEKNNTASNEQQSLFS